jgi:hypothetical protein
MCSSVKNLQYTTQKGVFQSLIHGVSFPCRQPVSESLTLSLPAFRTSIFCAPKPYWWHDTLIYLKRFVFGNSLLFLHFNTVQYNRGQWLKLRLWQLQIPQITEFVIQHRQI